MRILSLLLFACSSLYAAGPVGGSYLNLKKIGTPSTPASGLVNFYFKSDADPYYLTSAGVETQIGVNSVISVGTFDSQTPAANGLVVSAPSIFAQSASASVPGMVNTSTQTFAGVKTFTQAPIMSALTASEVVVTNSSKALASIPYAFPATGSTIAIRDSNGNLVGNSLISNTTNVVSSGGTTSLNGGSAQIQNITGTSSQTVRMPDATTLINGWVYYIDVNTTQNVTIQDNGGNLIAVAVPGSYARLSLFDNSTTNGSWDLHWFMPTQSTWGTQGLTVTGNLVVTGTLTVPSIVVSSGITAPYFSSSAANPASAGVLRLANSDQIAWRNSTNSGNNTLSMSTDTLTYSSNISAANVVATNTVSGAALSVGSSSQFAVTGSGSVGSGTWNATNISVAKGGTGQSFTVGDYGALVMTAGTVSASSIAGNATVVKAPTMQKYESAGSGTYTRPSNPAPLYIKVIMSGGGGGGGGSSNSTADAGSGSAGGSSAFGSSLLTANGGAGGLGVGSGSVSGGVGGTITINSPATGKGITGAGGGAGGTYGIAANVVPSSGFGGGPGGGKGIGGGTSSPGADAINGGGGGGSGAAYGSAGYAGGGGGAGGYLEAIITNPSATYPYTVGVGGGGGSGGSGAGSAGGAGSDGYIVVWEYYQ